VIGVMSLTGALVLTWIYLETEATQRRNTDAKYRRTVKPP
jgi:hypothetical protein